MIHALQKGKPSSLHDLMGKIDRLDVFLFSNYTEIVVTFRECGIKFFGKIKFFPTYLPYFFGQGGRKQDYFFFA